MTATPGPAVQSSQLAALLEASPDGVVLLDARGHVVAWNSAMLAASALPPEAMAAASIDTIDGCLTAIAADEARGMEPTGQPTLYRNIVTGHDGRLFERIEQRVDLSAVETGRIIWFRPFDIASDSSDAERRQLRSSSERRRHALRMESVGRLAGGIAHDFNNMLTVMIGFAEQLQSEIGEHESLNQVVRAARRSADLTRQLLAFSRQQVLRPSVVDVSSVVRSTGVMVDRLIGDDVRLDIDAPEGLPSVCADPAQLDQIILNLAINARDAMTRGGRLSISVRRSVVETPRPGRAVQPAGDYVQLVVTDTGDGIAPDLLSKVFEPFFTTKGMQGTGLGLATVYGIVKQSGGFIWVDSEVGAGTSFTIDLPVTTLASDAPVPADLFNAPAAHRSGSRILIVEDLEAVRTVTKEMLETAGYEVVAAASPREALAVMDTIGDRVDLVLTDVMMPEMTGSELAAAMRSKRPGLPVLFMSGLPKALDWNEPGSFLAKPFTRAMLLSHVRTRLAQAASAA
jgi:two-component system cell cycle sensor histidine kinase/response regulator CckA